MPRFPQSIFGRTPSVTVASSTAANPSSYDFICDGVADDVQIQAALDSLPTVGGVVELSEGIFYGNSATPLIRVTTASSKPCRHLVGQGRDVTVIRQNGTGHIISIEDASESFGYEFKDFGLDGQNAADRAINIQQGKDTVINNVQITGCMGDSINFNGLASLHNWIEHCRIGSGTTTNAALWASLQNACELRTEGNGYRVLGNYFSGSGYSVTKTITDASNATPIVITTSAAHELTTPDPTIYPYGLRVAISGVLGNTNANGDWRVTVLSPTTFELDGTVGNGAYTGAGTVYVRKNQFAWAQAYYQDPITFNPVGSTFLNAVLVGTAGAVGMGNIYEGCSFGMRSRGGVFLGDWFTLTTLPIDFSIARSKAALWPGPAGSNHITLESSMIPSDATALYDGEGDAEDGRHSVIINDNKHGAGNAGVLYAAQTTPAVITASQTAYNPPADSTGTTGRRALTWRLSADALGPWTISGIVVGAGSTSGRRLTIINVGANTFNLGDGQADTNGIITGTGAPIALAQNASRSLEYDSTSSRWRVIS